MYKFLSEKAIHSFERGLEVSYIERFKKEGGSYAK